MDTTPAAQLIRRLIAGDASRDLHARRAAPRPATTRPCSSRPRSPPPTGRRCSNGPRAAAAGRPRPPLVAVAAAYLAGDADRALLLARDHLADHPDGLLVAHIAAAPPSPAKRNPLMTTRRTAALMIAAAVLVNVAFTGLGAVFDYPDVLKHPAAEVLAAFRDVPGRRRPPGSWCSRSAPRCSPRSRSASGGCPTPRAMRWAVPVGIAAAAVQVVGLLRWPLLVPGWAARPPATTRAATAARRSPPPTACSATSSARPAATCSPPPGPDWCSSRSAPRSPDACSSRSAGCRPS